EAGDEVLVAVSSRIIGCLRAEDTAARLGGDEFGILVADGSYDAAVEVAERLSRALSGPLSTAFGEVSIRASIGVAVGRGDEGLDELLRQADTAMYAAKAQDTGGWEVFGVPTERVSSKTATV